jgi:hypothetical protein
MAVAVAIATELALARVEARHNRASIFFGSRRLARALVTQTSSLLCPRFAIGTPLQTTNEPSAAKPQPNELPRKNAKNAKSLE